MIISVNIYYYELKLSVCNHNIIHEGSVSQNFDLGLSSYFMLKKRVTFRDFFLCQFLHFIKSKLGPISKF